MNNRPRAFLLLLVISAIPCAAQARAGMGLSGAGWKSWHDTKAGGVIRHGLGSIIISTLDIAGTPRSDDPAAHAARKLLLNCIAFHRR